MSLYEVVILGACNNSDREAFTSTLAELTSEFGLKVGDDIGVRDVSSIEQRQRKAATVAVYFGTPDKTDAELAESLAKDCVPIIPIVGASDDFGSSVPSPLLRFNGYRRRPDDPKMIEAVSATLECIGLLRQQRRVFVSYRRTEYRIAAAQLHDLIAERGFDVFLDTHDIRPGEPFQEVLWHRLCDSDVLLMLDTPTYFESKWTRQEIGRALAKEIHVLRVVWPEHKPTRLTELSETIYLEPSDLEASEGPIQASAADKIILAVEHLRSRSIAARYMSITGKLRSEVEKIGGSVQGVGAHRAVAIRLEDSRIVWAYPIVGVPSAEILNDVVNRSARTEREGIPILVYDHVGIREIWSNHLKWLDEHIKVVRSIKVSEAGWQLAGLEN